MNVYFKLEEKKEGQEIFWCGIDAETAWEYDDYCDEVGRYGDEGTYTMTGHEFRNSDIHSDFNRAYNLLPVGVEMADIRCLPTTRHGGQNE